MQRRTFLAGALATSAVSTLARRANAQTPAVKPPVRIGVDIYSLQSQPFAQNAATVDPFQSLDYRSRLGVKAVHFSEIRFPGNLDPDRLKKVRQYAVEKNIDLAKTSMYPSPTPGR